MHACRVVVARTASSSAGESTSSTTTYPSRRNLAARAASSRGREAPASSRDIPSEPRPEPPRGAVRRGALCFAKAQQKSTTTSAGPVAGRSCPSPARPRTTSTHISLHRRTNPRDESTRAPREPSVPHASVPHPHPVGRIANPNPRQDPSPGGTSAGRRLVAPFSRVFLFRLVSIRFSTWRPRRARPSSRQPCPRRRRRRACRPRHPSSCRARRDRPGRLDRTPCVGARPGRARRRGR